MKVLWQKCLLLFSSFYCRQHSWICNNYKQKLISSPLHSTQIWMHNDWFEVHTPIYRLITIGSLKKHICLFFLIGYNVEAIRDSFSKHMVVWIKYSKLTHREIYHACIPLTCKPDCLDSSVWCNVCLFLYAGHGIEWHACHSNIFISMWSHFTQQCRWRSFVICTCNIFDTYSVWCTQLWHEWRIILVESRWNILLSGCCVRGLIEKDSVDQFKPLVGHQ